ncbi:MAG: Do family serine endopeptidase [Bacteroidaceae bacterium]|nr:Do family serine endopeptidase [Bacteroidaceae bacterium]
MKSTIKKIFGYSALMFGSALVAGVTTYKLMEKHAGEEAVVAVQQDGSYAMPTALFDNKPAQPIDLTGAAENSLHAVVHIKSTQLGKTQTVQQMPDLFDFFFGDGMGRQQQVRTQPRVGFGSGVIISEDGYIVTNNHVIDGADEIDVKLNDNREFKGKLIGTDPNTDLALVKIEGDDFPTIPVGDSDALKVGEWVLAVGNPFNLTSTVTAGIVSAKARTLGVYNGGIESFIQTDAAINQGNSGGALVNARGELVGINAVLSSPTGAYAGYGFAIPTSIMTKVVDDLKEFGTVQRAILGISGYDLGDERTKDKDLGTVEGVYVAEVTDGSGAKAAGIESGDVIVKITGKKVHNMAELQENIAKHRPGDKVSVTIMRGKKEKDLNVTLKNMQGNTEVVKKFDLDMLGAAFQPISDDVKRHLGVSYGLQVTGVDKGKFADAGIKKGFVILKVNGHKITSEEDLAEVLKAANQSPERALFISGYYMSGRRANYAVDLSDAE